MDLAQLANLGEFVGGIAVVVTLAYLAAQVRQTNRLTRAQVRQDTTQMSTDLVLGMNQDELDVIAQVFGDPSGASESELRFAGARFLATANYYEALFYAREGGHVDDELWVSRRHRMQSLFGPVRDSLWPTWKASFGLRFQRFVDETLLAEADSGSSPWASS